jgi:hypothetical protein
LQDQDPILLFRPSYRPYSVKELVYLLCAALLLLWVPVRISCVACALVSNRTQYAVYSTPINYLSVPAIQYLNIYDIRQSSDALRNNSNSVPESPHVNASKTEKWKAQGV